MNWGFVIFGVLAVLAGAAILIAGIRGGAGENPAATARLIGGMMLAAFGLVLAGFAIVFATAEPLAHSEASQ